MKRYLALLLFLGIALALPAHLGALPGDFEENRKAIERALADAGYPVEKVLDVGITIRNRGYEFPPLLLLMLRPNEAQRRVVEADPRTGTLIPVTVALMQDPEKNATLFTVVAWEAFEGYFDLDEKTRASARETFQTIYQALSSLAPMEYVPLPLEGALRAPYVGGKVTATEDLEEALLLTETGYQDRNMNVVGRTDFGGVHQLWLCSAEIARAFFSYMFPIASRAPCRAVVWKQDGIVQMVASDPAIEPSKVDPKAFPPDLMQAFGEVLEMNGGVLEDLGIASE